MKKVFVKTYGCQMNEYDSDKMVDVLNASQGLDTLTGGGGADHFVFGQEPWAPIHITDFQVGTDALDVSAMVSVWVSIFDALVDWWLDHPDQDAAAMTQRCVRLFAAVTRADLGSVLA